MSPFPIVGRIPPFHGGDKTVKLSTKQSRLLLPDVGGAQNHLRRVRTEKGAEAMNGAGCYFAMDAFSLFLSCVCFS